MAIRMKDIAAELGVSAMTVSKVLRGEGRIGQSTRERILRRVEELGYRPNLAARGLISGRRSLIGLIMPDLMHPFFASLAKHVSSALRDAGYSVAISSTEEDPDIEAAELSTYLAHRLDVIIIASSREPGNTESLTVMQVGEVPVLLIDRMIPDSGLPFIGSDDHQIGMLATGHLIERGYRRIAHIAGPAINTAAQRLNGYLSALDKAGLENNPSFVVAVPSSDAAGEQSGYEAMRKLLALDVPPDAVFCYNDILAYGAMRAALELGLRIPTDVALVGVSNLAALSYWDNAPVALTTIDQDIAELAGAIAEQALAMAADPACATISKMLPGRLVIRQST